MESPGQRAGRLSTETVLSAALRLADDGGLDSVSMRRLAAELNVTPMALYKHIEDKQALVDLMADRALGELPQIDISAAWPGELHTFFLSLHRLLVMHPALAEVTIRRPVEGPIAARLADQVLELLTNTGFSDEQAASIFVTLFNYTCGASLYRLSRARPLRRRLDQIDPRLTPTAFRMRQVLARSADEQHISEALGAIIASLSAHPAHGREGGGSPA